MGVPNPFGVGLAFVNHVGLGLAMSNLVGAFKDNIGAGLVNYKLAGCWVWQRQLYPWTLAIIPCRNSCDNTRDIARRSFNV